MRAVGRRLMLTTLTLQVYWSHRGRRLLRSTSPVRHTPPPWRQGTRPLASTSPAVNIHITSPTSPGTRASPSPRSTRDVATRSQCQIARGATRRVASRRKIGGDYSDAAVTTSVR